MTYRLGVDAGGTFTDFVLADDRGNIHLFKATSTPEDGTRAIAEGFAQMRIIVFEFKDNFLFVFGAVHADVNLCGEQVGRHFYTGYRDQFVASVNKASFF